jgi:hypothetical protein
MATSDDEIETIIKRLAEEGLLRPGTDLPDLIRSTQNAVELYFHDVALGTSKERHDEIHELYKAAIEKRYGDVVDQITSLSLYGRLQVEQSARRRGVDLSILLGPTPPTTEAEDVSRRNIACDTIASLVGIGGQMVDGRMRPSGRRSRSYSPLLLAPQSSKHPPKREWEEILVERMQIAWRRAVKDDLPRTVARHHKHPFVIFVEQIVQATCLKETGARHMSVVDMFNKTSKTPDNEGDLDSASE